jgi:SAM-dependent methyltransferase
MPVFGGYAQFYDVLYQDKDYPAECDFLEQIFASYAVTPVYRILDLGCGTGGHALVLGRRGYDVTGVDRSEEMLATARHKASQDRGLTIVPKFQQADICELGLGTTFDAVVAMFAVMSYMTSNADLLASLAAVRRHLMPGGLFIFDAWFGPAVLAERPSDRQKIIESRGTRIVRFAHPETDVVRHTVNVHYRVLHLKDNQIVDEVEELHTLRFLFAQEIVHYLQEAGLEVKGLCPFMRLREDLSERDWNFTVIAEAK